MNVSLNRLYFFCVVEYDCKTNITVNRRLITTNIDVFVYNDLFSVVVGGTVGSVVVVVGGTVGSVVVFVDGTVNNVVFVVGSVVVFVGSVFVVGGTVGSVFVVVGKSFSTEETKSFFKQLIGTEKSTGETYVSIFTG